MYLYEQIFKIIAMKGIPVDQSSCNSFSELIHEHQVCKNISVIGWERELMNKQREKRGVARSLFVISTN